MSRCKHHEPCQEYDDWASQFKLRECFEVYDQPILGTLECLSCGQVFLYKWDGESDQGDTDIWLYLPISPEEEARFKQGMADPNKAAKDIKLQLYLQVLEPIKEGYPCTARWIDPEHN